MLELCILPEKETSSVTLNNDVWNNDLYASTVRLLSKKTSTR
jgi:hypothetical protein